MTTEETKDTQKTTVEKETKVTKEVKAAKEPKEPKAAAEPKTAKDSKETKAVAEPKTAKEPKEKESKGTAFSLKIINTKGEKVGTQKLDESIFGIAPNVHILHQVCRAQLAAQRAGTHSTKTRGEVSGGGKKPFRQKGTGRARQGTIRAPQHRGGGVVFGPHPRSYAFKVNGKEVKLALRSALSAKQAEGVVHLIDSFGFEKPSTKEAIKCLDALDIQGRVTLVLTDNEVNAILSFRNIPRVRVIDVCDTNTYDLIDNKALVFTKAALQRIEEVLQ